jgi:hypothetical protein
VDPVAPAPPWEAGRQAILNETGARVPEHTFNQPVPIVARIVWANDGEEHVETEALGWTDRDVYVRMPDRRYNRTAVWLTPRTFDGAERAEKQSNGAAGVAPLRCATGAGTAARPGTPAERLTPS